jgi:uncharacterized protein (TIGR02231 family)
MRIATAVVFSAIGLGGGGLGGEGALAADVAATSTIDAVTVFPSGAEVTRAAKVKLPAGESRIVFADLPASAIAQSIRVEGKSAGKLDIGSVDTKRLAVPRSDQASSDAERRKLEDQIEALRDTRSLYDGQVQAAAIQRTLLANLAESPKVPPAPGTGGVPTDWKGVLGTIGTGMADLMRAELEGQIKIRETDRKINELQGKLAAIAPSREERMEVSVFVAAGGALEADLVVKYQVPSASWTALYDARLTTGTKTTTPKLDLTRRAAITQSTGEKWENVALSLSTTRPSVGASAPELRTLSVDYVPDAPTPVPMASVPAAPARAMKRKEDANGDQVLAGIADGGVAAAAPVLMEARARNAEVVQAPFQAIYGVPGRVSVPPSGETKRVQLMEETIEPQLTIRTVPKLDAKAYLYAKLVLPKTSAVLPGAVSLFRDGTFVGTGRLPLLAPGEEHELGFGADDSVRVKHAIAEDKRGEKGLISSSKTDTRNYKITVKNLHERAIAVAVFDHIPVSQQQDIKVTMTARPQPAKTDVEDKRGVLVWENRLEPDQEQVIEFGYQVVWPGAKAITYGR